jgi:hypothetical protein
LPHNFTVNGSVSSDEIGALPNGFVSYFNTPKMRVNLGVNNSGFMLKNRLGFGASMSLSRWLYVRRYISAGAVSASTIQ